MAGAGQAYDEKIRLAAGVHNTDDKISRSVSNGKKQFFFQVWQKTVGRRRQALAPRPWIHLISSRPYILAGLAQHEAGWPWAEPMSRSNVYRLRELFLISVLTFCNEKKQIAQSAAVCKKGEKIKLLLFSPFFPQRRYEDVCAAVV